MGIDLVCASCQEESGFDFRAAFHRVLPPSSRQRKRVYSLLNAILTEQSRIIGLDRSVLVNKPFIPGPEQVSNRESNTVSLFQTPLLKVLF